MQKDKLPAKNLPVACAVEIIIGFAMEHAGDIIRRISPFAEAFDKFSLLCSHAVTCSSANAD